MGVVSNAIKGHKAAIAKLVKEKYLDGSDSGQFKHRYVVEKPFKNILVHVEHRHAVIGSPPIACVNSEVH